MYAYVYRGQRLASGLFLLFSTLYFLRRGLSLNSAFMGLTDCQSNSGNTLVSTHMVLELQIRATTLVVYIGVGDVNSGTNAHLTDTVQTKLLLHPLFSKY